MCWIDWDINGSNIPKYRYDRWINACKRDCITFLIVWGKFLVLEYDYDGSHIIGTENV